MCDNVTGDIVEQGLEEHCELQALTTVEGDLELFKLTCTSVKLSTEKKHCCAGGADVGVTEASVTDSLCKYNERSGAVWGI